MDRKRNKKICLGEISNDWFEENAAKQESKIYLIFKKVTDIFFGCIGLVMFMIFFPIIAVLIKIDSKGPVLYCHKRVGKDGKIFKLCKFRNMTASPDQYSKVWREEDKSNITLVGRFLRGSHLDELPQSVSLLKGDLSFIGPRPEWIELAKIFEKEIPYYKNRYLVKPGIIGWAQINFPPSRSVEEAKEKFEYDLYYIKNRSFLLDLEIILKAVKLFFF